MDLAPADQRSGKQHALSELLDMPVEVRPAGPDEHYRTTVRLAVDGDGRLAYRRRASHQLIGVDSCLVAHPAVEEVIVAGRFPGAEQVTVRVGARTGERLVVVAPSAEGADPGVDGRLIGADELAAGRRAWIHELAAARRWRISAASFFQASPEAAETLAAAVGDALGPLEPETRLLDLYAGVGLLGGVLAAGPLTAVESSPSAAADARINLAGLDARVVRSRVERFHPRRADAVVADPARRGLGRAVVTVIGRTRADRLALVSCDRAALRRDAATLRAVGWRLGSATLVDAFPQTSQVEVVTGWSR
jgi:tRNA/tmRNA/rRNA uracil-C5-methylase (TrmA/RlmC/RlmD family)